MEGRDDEPAALARDMPRLEPLDPTTSALGLQRAAAAVELHAVHRQACELDARA